MSQSVHSASQHDIEPVRKQLIILNSELENESVRNMNILKQSVEESEQVD